MKKFIKIFRPVFFTSKTCLLLPVLILAASGGSFAQNWGSVARRYVSTNDVFSQNFSNQNNQNSAQKLPVATATKTSQTRTGGEELVVSAESGWAEFEPCAALHPTDSNTVVAAFTAMSENPLDLVKIGVRVSHDFGKTWVSGNLDGSPENLSTFSGGLPTLAFDANGRAHLVWVMVYVGFGSTPVQYRLHHAFSDDAGATWTNAAASIDKGTLNVFANMGKSLDKPALAFEPKSKNLVLTYTRLSNTAPNADQKEEIIVRRLAPGSTSWSAELVVNKPENFDVARFSHLDADGLGKLHLVFSGTTFDGRQAIYYSVSADGGASFSEATALAPFHFPNIGTGDPHTCTVDCSFETLTYNWPRIHADRTSGDLLLTWNSCDTTTAASSTRVFFKFKKSGQAEWSPTRRLHPTPPDAQRDHFFASIFNSGAGVWLASFYDQSVEGAGGKTHHSTTFSTDGCQSFVPPTPCTAEPTDLCTADDLNGLLNGGFGPGVGANAQIVARRHAALAIWSDGRAGNGDLSILACRVALPQVSGLSDEPAAAAAGVRLRLANPVRAGWFELGVFFEQNEVARAGGDLSIFSTDGKMLARQRLGSGQVGEEQRIEFFLPEHGIYFLKMETSAGCLSRRLLVF